MFWQFIINGLITGVLYSLMAIGFALVYNTTRIFHIAAAGIYVFAAYMFWLFAVTLHLPLLPAAFIAIVLTMVLSLTTEVTVYRPLKKRKASLNVVMIASIGLLTVIVNLIAMFFGNETKVVDNSIQQPLVLGNVIVTMPQMWQLIVGACLLLVFMFALRWTNWGVRLRALSSDETLYETLGYNARSSRTVVFLLSAIFIAVASCLTVYDVGMDPNMGMTVLINAMVAMIIGGVGRFSTCLLGGLTLGVLQAVTVYFFSSNWQNAVTFLVLLIFLFLRPQGIAGYKQRTV